MRVNGAGDSFRHLVLEIEDVREVSAKATGPDVPAGFSVDKLGGNPQPPARAPDAALDDVTHARVAPGLTGIHRASLVRKGAAARDDKERADTRECGGDVLDGAAGEVVLLRIAAHVPEG